MASTSDKIAAIAKSTLISFAGPMIYIILRAARNSLIASASVLLNGHTIDSKMDRKS